MVDRFGEKFLSGTVTERILTRIGALIKKEAFRMCPIDKGGLRQTISYRVEGDEVVIRVNSDYAEFVEYGTGVYHTDEEGNPDPHEGWDVRAIPVSEGGKGFLAWESGRKARLSAHKGPKAGKWIYAQKVHIEGAHPKPFLRPAVHQNIPQMTAIIREELSR